MVKILTDKIAFTVRLYGKDLDFYRKYKEGLEAKIPNVSHSQAIASMIKELESVTA